MSPTAWTTMPKRDATRNVSLTAKARRLKGTGHRWMVDASALEQNPGYNVVRRPCAARPPLLCCVHA